MSTKNILPSQPCSLLEQESLAFIKRLQTLYLENRDMNAILHGLEPETSWIGTGEQELCIGLSDAEKALTRELLEYPGSFQVLGESYRTRPVSENVCLVYGQISAKAKDSQIENLYNRVTAVCIKTADGMKLAHLHMSRPDCNQERGCYYVRHRHAPGEPPLSCSAVECEEHLRRSELEALAKNTPGGMHQCHADSHFTIISMSDSFLSLFGYNAEEIRTRFHNRYAEMIFEEDREAMLASTKRQLSRGDTVELEYRVRRKDGQLIWILDKGNLAFLPDGSKTFFCVLLDISEQKREREILRLSLERHQIIMDQATDIIFEWDIQKDTIVFSSNWKKKFGYTPIFESASKWIPLSPNIYSDDMPALLKLMRDTAAGVPYSEIEFRIRTVLGSYTWCKIRATTQYDGSRHPIKAVGVILDIDSDKRQKERLLDQARRDSLTGLLNKNTARQYIEKSIAGGSGKGIMLIIDLDDFKQINDRYGHLCGDTVLTDAAGRLRRLFRLSDFVARIGGDEFLVYLPGASPENAAARANRVIRSLREIQVYGQQNRISCSIGGAAFPKDAADFQSLYHCADLALYHVKNTGKNNAAFYDASLCHQELNCKMSKTAVSPLIDSETWAVSELLGQYCFRMLYHAIDAETAVRQILEIVGLNYDVSRVYIFESSEDEKRCSNTFEWCGKDAVSQMDELQNLRYDEDLGGYLNNFNGLGIFHCDDISQLHPRLRAILDENGVCSLLQCAIMDDGQFKGFVGFEECRENRYWTQDQIQMLTLVANVLSTFLLKLRLKEQLSRLRAGSAAETADPAEK